MILKDFNCDKTYHHKFRKLMLQSLHKRTSQSIQAILNIPFKNSYVSKQLSKTILEPRNQQKKNKIKKQHTGSSIMLQKYYHKQNNTLQDQIQKYFPFMNTTLTPIHNQNGKKNMFRKRKKLNSRCVTETQHTNINHYQQISSNLKITKNTAFYKEKRLQEKKDYKLKSHTVKQQFCKKNGQQPQNKQNNNQFCPWQHQHFDQSMN